MDETQPSHFLTPESPEKAAEYFRLAISKIEACDASLSPLNYSLFYHHVAGSNPCLNDRIDELFNSTSWTHDVAERLFLRYLMPSNKTEATELEDEISTVIENVANAANILASLANKHAFGIDQHEIQLSQCTHSHEVQAIAKEILSRTKQLHRQSLAQENELRKAAIKITRLHEELLLARRETMIDTLTGVNNRKVFDQEIQRLVCDLQAYDFSFSMLMVDIDHFKNINDQFGHLIGDKVLRQLAKQISSKTRSTDIVARYGGEEFAVLLPDTELAEALKVAEHIRESVGNLNMRRSDNGQPIGRVTASFGVAQCKPQETPYQLIARADKALYRAKATGRNNTVVAK